jgi:4-hydroxyphenylpyruvate dioxygenase
MYHIPAITTPSLGNADVHSIEEKLRQASRHGFKLLEVVEDDILAKAKTFPGGATDTNQAEAARYIKSLCYSLGLKPHVLQPFWFYEGLLDRNQHALQIKKVQLWMQLVNILDVQLIQVPTNWLREGTTGDIEVIVRDLEEMARIGLQQDPVVSFAYEAVAWGTHIDTWEGTWEIVKRLNMHNFGLCLDTFHIAARVWGDPTRPGCQMVNGNAELAASMQRLVQQVDRAKIFMVQVGDAERLSDRLVAGHPFHCAERLPRMSWSRNARLFAFEEEEGGCLPLAPVLQAIFRELKYDGFVSMEMFSEKLFLDDPEIPAVYAARAMKSWNKLMAFLT